METETKAVTSHLETKNSLRGLVQQKGVGGKQSTHGKAGAAAEGSLIHQLLQCGLCSPTMPLGGTHLDLRGYGKMPWQRHGTVTMFIQSRFEPSVFNPLP